MAITYDDKLCVWCLARPAHPGKPCSHCKGMGAKADVVLHTGRVHTKAPGAILDTTVKGWKPITIGPNGESIRCIGQAFKPTWEIVMGHKKGRISDDEYTERYLNMLRTRYAKDQFPFIAALSAPVVTLTCFCREGKFCHRHILADVLCKVAQQNGIEVFFAGEVK